MVNGHSFVPRCLLWRVQHGGSGRWACVILYFNLVQQHHTNFFFCITILKLLFSSDSAAVLIRFRTAKSWTSRSSSCDIFFCRSRCVLSQSFFSSFLFFHLQFLKLSAVFVWYCSLIAFCWKFFHIWNRLLSLESRFCFSNVCANS